MQYMLLIYLDESAMQSAPADAVFKMSAAYTAYSEAMAKAGVMVGGERLRQSAAATTLRGTDGKTQVLDGPYADVKEQLGGYYILDVPDLDAALAWAKRCPAASNGTVELRPIWPMEAA